MYYGKEIKMKKLVLALCLASCAHSVPPPPPCPSCVCVKANTQVAANESSMAPFSPNVLECKFVALEAVQDGGAFICSIKITHPLTGQSRVIVNPGVEGNCLNKDAGK